MKIVLRRPPANERVLYLIGPGGVGKSTLGKLLAPELDRRLIDLDDAFCDQIGSIGDYIRAAGSDAYYHTNSALAQSLVSESDAPCVFVASSGILSNDNPRAIRKVNHDLILSGYSISLLPSLNLNDATHIVVERQLQRGFGLKRAGEEHKFRERFALYREAGDMLVVSNEIGAATVAAIAARLQKHTDP